MAVKIVQGNLDDDELALANFLANEVGEYRDYRDSPVVKQLLAFMYPSRLDELKELLEACDSDYFTDGTMKMEFNGSDLVFDVMPICSQFNIDPSWLLEEAVTLRGYVDTTRRG